MIISKVEIVNDIKTPSNKLSSTETLLYKSIKKVKKSDAEIKNKTNKIL